MQVSPHPWLEGKITVRELKLFVQYSEDEGQTWVRREWTLPGFQQAMAFSRGTMLEDGTVLVPVYGMDTDGNGRSMVWRSGRRRQEAVETAFYGQPVQGLEH